MSATECYPHVYTMIGLDEGVPEFVYVRQSADEPWKPWNGQQPPAREKFPCVPKSHQMELMLTGQVYDFDFANKRWIPCK